MDERVRRRFEAKVDRASEHHLWLGASKADGTGMLKVDGRPVSARRVAWELDKGPLQPGVRVRRCAGLAGCVRVEHLSASDPADDTVDPPPPVSPTGATNPRRSAGSMRQTSPGRWELSATAGRHPDGSVRRSFRTIDASNSAAAGEALAAFVAESRDRVPVRPPDEQTVTVDAAIEQFLSEHLLGEKGREPKTVNDYRLLHHKWFAPEIGATPLRSIDEAVLDRLFGLMTQAGLSQSRLNQAKALYRPFFRWAKARHLIERNPMADFRVPTARKASKERTAPEVHEMVLLLTTAAQVVPDVAPILTLGAVSGMRRGELLGLRRSRLRPETRRIVVDAAISESGRVKATKTRRERTFHIDAATMTMLTAHCAEMDQQAASKRVQMATDPFVFSLTLDCSTPMPPHHLTRRVSVLKEYLGIADKHPETIALEDEALRLYRQPPATRDPGVTGPAPKGGFSLAEIGRRLNRSDRWVAAAVQTAERREHAAVRPDRQHFDGSILALRKFTSTELLDAGFNISMVAQRQGHSPTILLNHYAKARPSADRQAADHLGRVIHQQPHTH